MKIKAFKAALPYTIPICAGFLLIGMSYGFLMQSKGFSFLYPLLMSLFIFAGSMEFVAINLLLAAFDPLAAFFLTLTVNARHLFYGIAMLEKYKNCGWKKSYLIYGMCDESFSINCTVTPAADIDRGWFMFFVTFLNHLYWVLGATLGAFLGQVIPFNSTGIEFIMTALFVVMFMKLAEKWIQAEREMTLLLPLQGVSMIDAEGQVFNGPEERQALFNTLKEKIDNPFVKILEMEHNINEDAFAVTAAKELITLMEKA